jgi:hypothetical protein
MSDNRFQMTDNRHKKKIVIPAKAGIQKTGTLLDFCCYRNDALLNLDFKRNKRL